MKKNNIREGCCCGEEPLKQLEFTPGKGVRIKIKRDAEHLAEVLGREELTRIIINQLAGLDESELEDLIKQYDPNRA